MDNKSHVPNHQPVYIYVGALGKTGISSASMFRYHEMTRLDWIDGDMTDQQSLLGVTGKVGQVNPAQSTDGTLEEHA